MGVHSLYNAFSQQGLNPSSLQHTTDVSQKTEHTVTENLLCLPQQWLRALLVPTVPTWSLAKLSWSG